jgi:hypothetical protein
VLGTNDSLVLQVRALLDMARALPRPHGVVSAQNRLTRTKARKESETQAPAGRDEFARHSRRQQVVSAGQLRSVSGSETDQLSAGDDSQVYSSDQQSSIFRRPVTQGVANADAKNTAPLIEITVSKESTDGVSVPASSTDINVFIAAALIPEIIATTGKGEVPSAKLIGNNSFDEAECGSGSVDAPAGASSVLQKSLSYDCEESCLVSMAGIDSECGRIHFPSAWASVRPGSGHETHSDTVGKDLVLTRAYREGTSLNSEVRSSSSNAAFVTGNKARDELMSRARALLQAHGESGEVVSNGGVQRNPDHAEDGIAPLGGHWVSTSTESATTRNEKLNDPMNNLPWIHDEAAKTLQVRIFVDA